MSTAIVPATQAFEPSNAEQAFAIAKTLVASRLLPKSIGTPEAAFTIIMTGRELGLTAMQSLRSIHVIEGKPTLSADLMLALTKRSAECEWFRLVESTPEIATYETKRRGEPEATRMSFTIKEAQAAGLASKENYKRHPTAMLRARCVAALARAVYPDLLLGVYETGELSPERVGPSVPITPGIVNAPTETVDVDALRDAINAATTKDELVAVGKRIAATAKKLLAEDEVADLQAAYSAKKAALSAERDSGADVNAAPGATEAA